MRRQKEWKCNRNQETSYETDCLLQLVFQTRLAQRAAYATEDDEELAAGGSCPTTDVAEPPVTAPSAPKKGIEIMHKSHKEFYRAVAKQWGITCKMSDHCRCLDCQVCNTSSLWCVHPALFDVGHASCILVTLSFHLHRIVFLSCIKILHPYFPNLVMYLHSWFAINRSFWNIKNWMTPNYQPKSVHNGLNQIDACVKMLPSWWTWMWDQDFWTIG